MNLFQISSAIVFFCSLGFGLYVFSRNRKSLLNKLWLAFSCSVAIWSVSLYGVTSSGDYNAAFLWQYILDVAGITVPFLYYYFISEFLKLKNHLTVLCLAFGGILLALFSFTPYFKTGMVDKFDFFWINPGVFYFIFPLYFVITIAISIIQLVHGYRTTNDNNLKQQIKFQLLGAVIGFSGGVTNFLPQLFNIYPFGNYFITLYVFFIGYSAVHNRLFNIRGVAAELFSGGTILVFLFNLLNPTQTLTSWIINFVIFIIVLVFGILMIRSTYREILQREKIEKLAVDLGAANARQENLMHFVSHEVKGYLTKSMAAFSMLTEGDIGNVPDDVKNLATEALADNRKGVKAVTDILQASNLKKGSVTYDLKPVNVRDVVKNTIADFKTDAEQKGLKIRADVEGTDTLQISGDQEKLREHVFANLIKNAIAYTPAGDITITLKKEGSNAVFAIKDSGVGITPEDMQKLFTEGGRGKDSIKVNAHSTGYGLFIAKQIVDAHRGRISVVSKGAGKGSTFTVLLPLV